MIEFLIPTLSHFLAAIRALNAIRILIYIHVKFSSQIPAEILASHPTIRNMNDNANHKRHGQLAHYTTTHLNTQYDALDDIGLVTAQFDAWSVHHTTITQYNCRGLREARVPSLPFPIDIWEYSKSHPYSSGEITPRLFPFSWDSCGKMGNWNSHSRFRPPM